MAGEDVVSDEEHTTFQPAEDAETAPQNLEPSISSGKWEMPKPVFQKTSGYLPQGFEKVLADAKQADGNAATSAAVSAPAPEPAPPPAPPAVEPQPDISEHIGFEDADAVSPTAPKAKSQLLRIVLAVLAVAGILFLVAFFLVAVYFLFLAPTE